MSKLVNDLINKCNCYYYLSLNCDNGDNIENETKFGQGGLSLKRQKTDN